MAYKTYYEWPDQGYIPEDAYPLEVIHQDDTGYVLLQVDPMDADSLIVVASIDFNYEREGAVARRDIAGEELAFFRKLNLGNFFEKEGAKDNKLAFCDDCGSIRISYAETYLHGDHGQLLDGSFRLKVQADIKRKQESE